MTKAKLAFLHNQHLWDADGEFLPLMNEIVEQPSFVAVDSIVLNDTRTWMRVYLDGSVLDSSGIVYDCAPGLLGEIRSRVGLAA